MLTSNRVFRRFLRDLFCPGTPRPPRASFPAKERSANSSTRGALKTPDALESAVMHIGFFGGSFDPPHLGHLAVARAAAEAFDLDRVLLAPTARQPLKPRGASAGFADRLAMVALLCEAAASVEDPTPKTAPRQRGGRTIFEPSSLDAPRPDGSPNYTVDTLTRLRQELSPEDRILVIVGADAFLDIRRWRSPETLLRLAEWIVVSRPGFSLWQLDGLGLSTEQRARVHLLEHVHEPASATGIRALLRRGAVGSNARPLLPASVLEYIHAHRLYGVESGPRSSPGQHLR
ncbi:MAG: nicotinate-nicotinamide nucleotide adenylyltransferase [Acidobacteriota bacterium]